MEPFANVAALADLSPCFVLFLLRSPHFAEADFDIGGELQRWPMEGPCFLFRKPGLVLMVAVSDNILRRMYTKDSRMVTEVSAQSTHVLQPTDQRFDEHDGDHLLWRPRTSGHSKGYICREIVRCLLLIFSVA